MASTGVWFHTRYMRTGSPETPSSETLIDLQIGRTRNSRDNEKVVTIFGPTNSGNALAWKHIPNQKKIPVINPISTSTDITKPVSAGADNYMFRVSMVDREQISGLLAYTKANPAAKKIGFMAETTGYGQAGLKDLQEVSQ